MKTSLKQWLAKTWGVPADANDDAYNGALGQAFVSDDADKKMTADLFKTLSETPETKAAGDLELKLDKLLALTEKNANEIAELKGNRAPGISSTAPPLTLDVNKGFAAGANADASTVKHVTACKMYSDTKSALRYPESVKGERGDMRHPRAGEQVIEPVTGQPINTLSDLD